MFQVEVICSDPRCAEEMTLWVEDLDDIDLVELAACECGQGLVTVRVEGFAPVFAAV